MRTEGNVGRRLAEALYRLGNQVIISGRRKGHLAKTLEANPGMDSIELDVTAPGSILRAAREQISNYPTLNVLINDPGIMLIDDASAAVDDELVTSTIATNLMGPIRITGALIAHLNKQESAAVLIVSSVLGFTPMAMTAVYLSTKAALHSYAQSLRLMPTRSWSRRRSSCATKPAPMRRPLFHPSMSSLKHPSPQPFDTGSILTRQAHNGTTVSSRS
jgi:short-subunit dehydrogenase involved in D-alanine esterification of teichoic acids